MKRIAMLLFAGAFAGGCETSVSSTITNGPDSVKCQVTLATPPMIDAGGGSGSLGVTTQPECGWEASTTVIWISALSPPSGQGTASVSFRVAVNDGQSTRDGMIVVNGEQVRVSQRAPCRYDVGPSSQGMSASGGAGTLNISTTNDCAWTASSDSRWIALVSTLAGNGNGTVSFTVAPNQGDPRSGAILVANQRSTITQAGVDAPPCDPSISPTSQNVSAAGGPGTPISVTAAGRCQWTASSGATWIAITSAASGTGNGTVTFTVSANTAAARTGTLSIGGRASAVTQAAGANAPPPSPPPPPPPSPPPACNYSISPTNDSARVLGDTGSVDVSTTSACAWTASSNAAWITITSGGSGTGNGSVRYLVLPNIGGSRTGTLTIAGQTFTVTQAALACEYSITPTGQKVDAGAGSGTVAVSAGSTCTWSAVSNDPWITVTSGATGTGNGTVNFGYSANTGNRVRRGTLTVAGIAAIIEQGEN